MLPRKHRATTAQVKKATTKGKTRHSVHFSLRTTTTTSPASAAVVVSKKVVPTAVGRNTLKRRIRSILSTLVLPKDKIVVVYAKKGAPTLSPSRVKSELQELLK